MKNNTLNRIDTMINRSERLSKPQKNTFINHINEYQTSGGHAFVVTRSIKCTYTKTCGDPPRREYMII